MWYATALEGLQENVSGLLLTQADQQAVNQTLQGQVHALQVTDGDFNGQMANCARAQALTVQRLEESEARLEGLNNQNVALRQELYTTRQELNMTRERLNQVAANVHSMPAQPVEAAQVTELEACCAELQLRLQAIEEEQRQDRMEKQARRLELDLLRESLGVCDRS